MKNTILENIDLKQELLDELLKCSFCGLCEWVCPTLSVLNHRLYGPRGRVEIIVYSIQNGVINKEIVESVYTCLLCKACNTQCPAGIDIAGSIRRFRTILYPTKR